MHIQILIPTFNRTSDLIKNLKLLDGLISNEKNINVFEILVSENRATYESQKEITLAIEKLSVNVKLYKHDENIGGERNCIFLLKQATADFIMFVGDDDFLPANYLTYIFNTILNDKNSTAIIPGFSALYADGRIEPARYADFDEKKYPSNLTTILSISNFGHQLSGIVFKREKLFENYTKYESNRNLYPFIFFLAYNIKRGHSYYAPKYQVLVSQGNSKDWNYDASGLLTDILRNYSILFPNSPIKRWLCGVSFISKQSWRLRAGKDLRAAWAAFSHLARSEHVDLMMKLSLPFLYGYSYARSTLGFVKRRVVRLIRQP